MQRFPPARRRLAL